MNLQFLTSIAWVIAAGVLGFAISAVFSAGMRLSRNLFLILYVSLVTIFLAAFIVFNQVNLAALLTKNWLWGAVGALLVGAFLVRNVFSQPASVRSAGFPLAFELLWSGVVYGLVDSLLLSVLPVLAIWQAFSLFDWTVGWPGKIIVGVIGFIASLFVTICYHLGFPEYRVKKGIFGPTIGNGIMTIGYLLTNNPITAIFSHIAMHIAGVWRGPASVMQLPPHY
jgi:hypothetical protein